MSKQHETQANQNQSRETRGFAITRDDGTRIVNLSAAVKRQKASDKFQSFKKIKVVSFKKLKHLTAE